MMECLDCGRTQTTDSMATHRQCRVCADMNPPPMTNTIDTLEGIIARAKAFANAGDFYDYYAVAVNDANGEDVVLCCCNLGDYSEEDYVQTHIIPAFIFDMTDEEFSDWQKSETQRRADVEKQRLDKLRAEDESHERAELARLKQKYGE